jgi:PKD domain-containing protein
MTLRPSIFTALCAAALFCAPARADWFDSHWQYRRALKVNWDAARAVGGELATAELYTAGHESGGRDVRVTTANGGIVPSRVLDVGPGDLLRLVFALAPGQNNYYVYFGNPHPPPPPAGTDDVQYRCGLLMEMKSWPLEMRRAVTSEQIIEDWEQSGPVTARAMIDEPFYAEDPIADAARRIFRISGSFYAFGDTDYFFAGGAEGSACLCLDGQPVLFMLGAPKDAQFHVTVHLTRGRHDFVVYYIREIDKGLLAITWRQQGTNRLVPVPRTLFGVLRHAQIGPLDQFGKTLVADFDAEFEGECPVGEQDQDFSYRYLFTARVPAALSPLAISRFDWDFGDGITAGGAALEHVYAVKGDYPVRLTLSVGGNSDTQTSIFHVDRERDDSPIQDPPLKQGRILARYDASKLPEPWLAPMTTILRDAQLPEAELAAARQLAQTSHHAHPDFCLTALQEITEDLEAAGKAAEAADMLDLVPPDSDLQPAATAAEVEVLNWWLADFPRALKAAQRIADSTDPAGQFAYAQCLVLCNRAAEGNKILDDLEDQQEKAGVHLAAVSGAMARTIEYRLDQKDWRTGESEWDTWETRCPAVFMQGYSVLLRTELMEQRFAFAAAAKIDEAFATAVPNSAYAPELLFRAARLTAKTDPAKSRQLRDRLKTMYPEDPLSQN